MQCEDLLWPEAVACHAEKQAGIHSAGIGNRYLSIGMEQCLKPGCFIFQFLVRHLHLAVTVLVDSEGICDP